MADRVEQLERFASRLGALVDRLWPRGAIAALSLAAVIGIVASIAAIGSTPREDVEDALQSWAGHVADHDGARACAEMTPQLQGLLRAFVPTVDCPTYIRSFSVGFNTRALQTARLTQVQIEQDAAVIPKGSALDGDTPIQTGFTLQRSGDRWLVSGILR